MAKSKSSVATAPARDGNRITKYFNETRAELRKVTWPTRDETRNLTTIIVIVTVAMAMFLGLLDYIFQVVAAGIVSGDFVRIVVGVLLFFGGVAAFYYNNQE